MKKFVFISDIHSNIEALRKIEDLPEFNDPESMFVFLGDYIDGYDQPNNGGIDVIKYVKDLCDVGKAEALVGNHDEFLIRTAMGDGIDFRLWLDNGGNESLTSWGIDERNFDDVEWMLKEKFFEEIKFLASSPVVFETNNILAVHAGFNWDLNLYEQKRDEMMWARELYFFEEPLDEKKPIIHTNDFGKVIVSGHTPTYFINGDETCPIIALQNNNQDKPRFVIDGGSMSRLPGTGLNVLVLDKTGKAINKYRL